MTSHAHNNSDASKVKKTKKAMIVMLKKDRTLGVGGEVNGKNPSHVFSLRTSKDNSPRQSKMKSDSNHGGSTQISFDTAAA